MNIAQHPTLTVATANGTRRGLLLGVASAVTVAVVDPELVAVTALPLILAAVLAVTDQYTARIANRHSIELAVLTAVCVTVGIVVQRGSATAVAAGAAIWFLPLFVAALTGGAGGGDFKYAISLGAITGWVSMSAAVTGLLVAVLVASVAGMVTAVRQRSVRSQVRLGLPLYSGAVAGLLLTPLLNPIA